MNNSLADVAEIQFNSQRFGRWQTVDVRESVDDLCASVSLVASQPEDGQAEGLDANTVTDILVGGELVTRVRPDLIDRNEDPEDRKLTLQARSLGRELVDCQYSATLNGLKLEEIVKRLCDTFKVPVKVEAETPIVPNFSMQCELPSNALINAVRAANLLLYPLPDGGLVLTEPTDEPAVATLTYGKYIKSYRIIDEHRLRFSDYVVKSFDYGGGKALAGAVKDTGISFFRPMHIVADRYGQSLGGCDRRAEFERNRRMARAHRIELKVYGWFYIAADGLPQYWRINTQVRVVIPKEGIDDVFLVGERAFRQDDQGGTVTVLQVMKRDAFLGAGAEKKKAKRGAGVSRMK